MSSTVYLSLLLALVLVVFGVGSAPEKRIINGSVWIDFIPYAVALNVAFFNASRQATGTGSFITIQHVLTAGNLLYGATNAVCFYGNNEVFFSRFTDSRFIHVHPDYVPETRENDVGIIVVGFVDPNIMDVIALPTPFLGTPLVNERGSVRGFGHTSINFITTRILRESYTRVLTEDTCRDLLDVEDKGGLVTETHFCVLDSENFSTICLADEGSPFVVDIDGIQTVVGLASIGVQMCRPEFPAIFSQVSPYVEWIRDLINATEPEQSFN